MSTLSQITKRTVVDPRKEGLPCFGIWANDGSGNQAAQFRVFNSDFQIISPPYGSTTSSTSTYRFGMAADQAYCYSGDYQSSFDSTTALSTNAFGAGAWAGSLQCNDQFPIGQMADCNSNGYMSGSATGPTNSIMNTPHFLIDQILPEGVRPRRYWCMNSNTFYEAHSLQALAQPISTYDLSTKRALNGSTEGFGSACYNENIKTLITTHGNATGALQVNVFKSTVDLNSVVDVATFFANATVTSCTVNITYEASSRYDRCIVLGDSGNFVIGYRNGNNLNGAFVNISNIASPVVTTLNAVAGTTSYGHGSGNQYLTRLQTTWDGKWACIYQPYYYYGCGICAYVVSIEDPSRYFTLLQTDSSYGGALMPLNKSQFAYFLRQNTDSDCLYTAIFDFTNTSRTGTGTTVVGTLYDQSKVASYANGAALNTSSYQFALTGGFYSTCYPIFTTINYWPINGHSTYAGAYR